MKSLFGFLLMALSSSISLATDWNYTVTCFLGSTRFTIEAPLIDHIYTNDNRLTVGMKDGRTIYLSLQNCIEEDYKSNQQPLTNEILTSSSMISNSWNSK